MIVLGWILNPAWIRPNPTAIGAGISISMQDGFTIGVRMSLATGSWAMPRKSGTIHLTRLSGSPLIRGWTRSRYRLLFILWGAGVVSSGGACWMGPFRAIIAHFPFFMRVRMTGSLNCLTNSRGQTGSKRRCANICHFAK